MKKNKLLSDIVLVVVSLVVFLVLRMIFGRSWLYFIVVPAIALAIHTFLMSHFDRKFARIQASEEYQMRQKFESSENRLSTYMAQLQKLGKDYPEFNDVVLQFIRGFYDFSAKEKVLKTLIEMNGDKAKRFLETRSQATQEFLVANAKKLVKSLIVYSAQSPRNRPANVEDVKDVQEVLKSTKDLADKYDLLLEEVKRMGDDFNPEDPGLKDAIENLQALRVAQDTDDEEEDDGEIHLTLNPSKGKTATSSGGYGLQQGGSTR